MKLIPLFLLFAMSYAATVSAQATANEKAGSRSADHANSKTQLQLTASIIEQMSCSPDHLSLTLRLTFRNIGTEVIILDKRSSSIAGYMVSRDLKAVAAKKYEEEARYSHFGADDIGFGFDPPADMSAFIILKPGETYDLESTQSRVSLWIYDGTQYTEDDLRAGTHFLQVKIYTWYYLSNIAVQMREKWSDKGFLWSETLTSLPMPFTVDKDRPVSNCSTTSTTK